MASVDKEKIRTKGKPRTFYKGENPKKQKGRGKLYGIGIGPGDPELLTIKACKILKKVDKVFAPRSSILAESLALRIIGDTVPKSKIRTIVFPMTKEKKRLKEFWEKAAKKVYKELSRGNDIAFITIGDPFIYSTYMYLLRYIKKLDKSIDICTIPGVSVVNAIASLCNVPLVEAEEKFAVLPLPNKMSQLKNVLNQFDTVVLLKIGKGLKRLVRFLEKEGYDGSVYFAKRIGRPEEVVAHNLSQINLNKKTLGYMSTMIIRSKKRKKKMNPALPKM